MFFIVFLCLCFSLLHSFFATALARQSYFGNNFSKREHKREEEPVIKTDYYGFQYLIRF